MNPVLRYLGRDLRAIWMLLIVGVGLAFATPIFLTGPNLLNVALAAAVTIFLALGETFVIIMAEIDLSVGATMGMSSVVTAIVLQDQSTAVGLLAGIGTGILAGLFNGILVTMLRMPAFIVTLGTMSVFSGLTLFITQGNPISISSEAFLYIGRGRPLGIPMPVVLSVVVTIILGILLARTRFGRHAYATGDNADASRLAGIRVRPVKMIAFMISGSTAAVAGFILAARLGTAQPTAGDAMELVAIAAVIIGGTSLFGGRGAIIGTLIGALLLGVIDNGLNLLDVSPFLQNVVRGAVILFAVFLDRNSDLINRFWRSLPRRQQTGTE